MSGVAIFLREHVYRPAILEGMRSRWPGVTVVGVVDSLADLLQLCRKRGPEVVIFLSIPEWNEWRIVREEMQITCGPLKVVAVDHRRYERFHREPLWKIADEVIDDTAGLSALWDAMERVLQPSSDVSS